MVTGALSRPSDAPSPDDTFSTKVIGTGPKLVSTSVYLLKACYRLLTLTTKTTDSYTCIVRTPTKRYSKVNFLEELFILLLDLK
jgi:hypothetical protein